MNEAARLICNAAIAIVIAILIYKTKNPWYIALMVLGWQHHRKDEE